MLLISCRTGCAALTLIAPRKQGLHQCKSVLQVVPKRSVIGMPDLNQKLVAFGFQQFALEFWTAANARTANVFHIRLLR